MGMGTVWIWNGDSPDLGNGEMGTVRNRRDSNRDSLELGKERGGEAPLFGRGYTAAEGTFRVPVIARWPGRAQTNGLQDQSKILGPGC